MGKTSIEWCDYSWPIVNGCRRISPGCENCYAERLTATRLVHQPKYKGLAVFGQKGPRWNGKTRLWEPHLRQPLKIRKPSKIFVADMGDLFYEKVPDKDIDRVFAIMALAERHSFQVLTKRPERMRDYILSRSGSAASSESIIGKALEIAGGVKEYLRHKRAVTAEFEWPLPNVWLGVSVENGDYIWRMDELRMIPAAVRFVSFEPLLEDLGNVNLDKIAWAIIGGESGPRARPMDIAWSRSLVKQCKEAGTACFMKQLGAKPFFSPERDGATGGFLKLADRMGGDMSEWDEDLRVREFPIEPPHHTLRY